MMALLRAIDGLFWADRFEPMRHLVAWGLVLAIAAFWLRHVMDALAAAAR